MTQDDHSLRLGWLLGNLQALEFILRAYLQKHNSTAPLGQATGQNFYIHPVDTELPENEITNYDSLGKLINKFNALMKQKGLEGIDLNVVDIRDALAHGRISGLAEDEPLHLIKYSKPKDGKVKVVYNEIMTNEWFKYHRERIYNFIILVHTHY